MGNWERLWVGKRGRAKSGINVWVKAEERLGVGGLKMGKSGSVMGWKGVRRKGLRKWKYVNGL